MNSEPGAQKAALRRVVIALDSRGAGAAQLAAAVQLASLLKAELRGLFLADSALQRLASLPFALEVSLASAQTRALSAAELARGLRVQAARMEAALGEAARAMGVAWSFDLLRDQSLAALLTRARESELVLVGGARRVATPGPWARSLRRQPVAVLCGEETGVARALDAAVQIARFQRRPLLVLCPSRLLSRPGLRERVTAQLGDRSLPAAFAGFDGKEGLAGVCRQAGRAGASLLVLDAVQASGADVKALEDAPCAVALVGGSAEGGP